MKHSYSIIIPIHNEVRYIKMILKSLEPYAKIGNEIVIIDDGSTDGTSNLLVESDLNINLITLKVNKGKGYAVRIGLKNAKYDKIIIFDGDMEIPTDDISKLMVLDKNKHTYCAMGYRSKSMSPLKSNFDWGNFMFTSFFNIIYNCKHKDILCCAKSFYLEDIKINNLESNGFDIDVELSTMLSLKSKRSFIPQVLLQYKRRSSAEGKKLKILDGWVILSRIIKMIKYL